LFSLFTPYAIGFFDTFPSLFRPFDSTAESPMTLWFESFHNPRPADTVYNDCSVCLLRIDLYAESKFGEMLAGMPKPKGNLGSRGVTKTLPEGVSKKESHELQKMAGELYEGIPDKATSSRKGTRSLPPTVDKKASHIAQKPAGHRLFFCTPFVRLLSAFFMPGSVCRE
jgi:hypothetical protein